MRGVARNLPLLRLSASLNTARLLLDSSASGSQEGIFFIYLFFILQSCAMCQDQKLLVIDFYIRHARTKLKLSLR